MENQRLQECVTALTQKNVRLPCPRCGNLKFSIGGEAVIPINENPGVFNVGGPAIPTIMVVCDHCGYVAHHAQGILGVLKKG